MSILHLETRPVGLERNRSLNDELFGSMVDAMRPLVKVALITGAEEICAVRCY